MLTDMENMQSQLLLEALSRLEGKLDSLTDRVQNMQSTMTGQIASLSEKVASLQKEKEQLFAFHNKREETFGRLFDELKDVANISANNARDMTTLTERLDTIESKVETEKLIEAERRGAWTMPLKLGALAGSLMAILGLAAWIMGN